MIATLEKFAAEIPYLRHHIYANTAASGLLYESLLEWRQEHDLDFLIHGSDMKMNGFGLLTETRKTIGTFFGCSNENVSLVPNFSLGMNLLLEGLKEAHHILLLKQDYPSLIWPFENRKFSKISYLDPGLAVEDSISYQVKNKGVTILAISLVQWLSGLKIDLKFLKLLKQEFPDLLIIADGTQFCGAFKLNFENSGIDILASSGYKWLMGGYGNGFMLFSERSKAYFSIKSIGFNAANANPEQKNTIRFAKCFEPGHLDTFNFGSLNFSLKTLSAIGMDKIDDQNQKLSKKAIEEFGAIGLLEDWVSSRKKHSTIVNIKGSDALYQHLKDHDVICSQRGGGIRLSFHFYNTESDIDNISEIIQSQTI